MSAVLPRGIRNHNPGNIDYHASSDPWRGLVNPPSDGRFCRFTSAEWGIRALCKTLMTYQREHHCRTIRDIVHRWAPPNENDTEAYIEHVARLVGVPATAPIDVTNSDVMRPLVQAIIVHENSQQPYDVGTLNAAMVMAGIEVRL